MSARDVSCSPPLEWGLGSLGASSDLLCLYSVLASRIVWRMVVKGVRLYIYAMTHLVTTIQKLVQQWMCLQILNTTTINVLLIDLSNNRPKEGL